jgi:beta-lactamase regulating signal transducer with metallopeptidase domain
VTAFHQTARTLAECLLNSMVEGVAIALFAWVVLKVSGRRSSSTRFAVWFSALIGIATLPWLHSFVPGAAAARPETPTSAVTLPGSWVTGVFLGWALLASLGVLRVLLGLLQLQRLRSGSIVIDPTTLDPKLQRTLLEFRSRTVTLAVSGQQQVPAAIGFFQPLIVLPAWSMRDLSSDELNSILIHELAHLGRCDDWTNLTQKLLRALFFFHPAIWWVESQASLEREMACDDVVLSKRVSPRRYAECLVSVAEKSFMRRGLAMAQAAVSRMRHTTIRVSQILDRKRSRATAIWTPALGMVTVFSAVCLVAGSRAPEMIAFRDAVPGVAVAAAAPARVVNVPVITAKWTEPAGRPISGSSRTNHKTRPSSTKVIPARRRSAPDAVDTNRLDANLVQPGSVATSLPVKEIALPLDGLAVQTVFVVMQGGEGPSQGSWTLCVWRVTVRSSGDGVPIEAVFPAKSI